MPLRLCLCFHNHQPAGNFDEVFERACTDCYEPLLDCLSRHPGIRAGLHTSGCLIEWMQNRRPAYLEKMARLAGEGRIELLSSGYFEPLLPIFRRNDIKAQIAALGDLLEGFSGVRPKGLWLTERVWEPSIPSLLAGTGISYAVVDDTHLVLAGVPEDRTGRPFLTEDNGNRLVLLASSKSLRYAIPFDPPGDVIDLLRRMEGAGTGLAFYGDDGEKFGVWPGTKELCWDRGWIDSFFDEVEKAGWIESVTPSEAVAALKAEGPVYIPAASYSEMGEWTLPPSVQEEVASLTSGLSREASDRMRRLLRGGFWRNFLSKYPESNELHKRVLHAEKAVKASGDPEALRHFWRSQCNCAYWHGVFGGLYLPHLRDAVWSELSSAERRAAEVTGDLPRVTAADIDCDGADEVHVLTRSLSVLVKAGAGLTVSELTFLPAGRAPVPLGHVLTRRREAYHADISDADDGGSRVRTIHSKLPSTEAGLASRLVLDSYRRVSFRTILLPRDDGREAWFSCSPSVEAPEEPGAQPSVERNGDHLMMSCSLPSGAGHIEKRITLDLSKPVFVFRSSAQGLDGRIGACEMCFNLLTGGEDDRFVKLGSSDSVRTGVAGTGICHDLVVEDGWRKVRIRITSPAFLEVAHMPLDSVNRSEKGYERVHQGMALLLSPGARSGGVLEFRMELGDLG